MSDWKTIWERKGCQRIGKDLLQSLIEMNGFNHPFSQVSVIDWREKALMIYEKLGLKTGDKVLDVGCGSGAMSFALKEIDPSLQIFGVDYSTTLIGHAKKALPKDKFIAVDAADMNFPKDSFDAVFSHSVFLYFPTQSYAFGVIEKMVDYLKPGKKGFILNVPDALRMTNREDTRRNVMSPEVYKNKYEGLRHYYYYKEVLRDKLHKHNCTSIIPRQKKDSKLDKYTFNILYTKKRVIR